MLILDLTDACWDPLFSQGERDEIESLKHGNPLLKELTAEMSKLLSDLQELVHSLFSYSPTTNINNIWNIEGSSRH
jgi:hypothetical protein